MDRMPTNEEEFRLAVVQELGTMSKTMAAEFGAVRTAQAETIGKLDVAIANHNALEKRVDGVENSMRIAKNWENAKFLIMGALQTAAGLFGIHHLPRLPGK